MNGRVLQAPTWELSSRVDMSEFTPTGNLNANCQGASRMKAILVYSVQSLQSGLVFAE